MNKILSLETVYAITFVIVILLIIPTVLKNREAKKRYKDYTGLSVAWWIFFCLSFFSLVAMPFACIMVLYKNIQFTNLLKKKNYPLYASHNETENSVQTQDYKDFDEIYSYIKELPALTMIDDKHSEIITRLNNSGNRLSSKVNELMTTAFERNIIHILNKEDVSHEEEQFVSEFIEKSSLNTNPDLQTNPYYVNFIQALCLRDIKEGKTVSRISAKNLPVLIHNNENLIWVYQGVCGYEQKTGRKYEGGSQGYSIRLGKNSYYRIGSSKGHSVSYQYEDSIGKGILVLTDRNVIFKGEKSVKIAINKILSIQPYSDGVEITKEGANSQLYTFTCLDPWLLVNAIRQLA